MEETIKLDPHCEMLMQQFQQLRPTLQQLSDEACAQLRKALDEQGIYITAMEHRVKTEKSLRGKLELKGAKYKSIDDITDLDILSSSTALQYLCMVNVLKHDGGRDGLKALYDLINGESDANGMIADMMLEQAQTLPFMQKKK